MKIRFSGLADIYAHGFDDVIDVRSPSEFAEDHLPGAVNLPVLDDAERVRVGTIYKQDSPFAAKVVGASLVAANAAAHLAGPLAAKPGGWRPLVYCWRGGQRSGALATILSQVGWRVGLVEGGYKSYRRMVVELLHDAPLPHRFVVLDGNTGTAKTEILARLASRGAQVIDLEGLAHHRGSVFGATGETQPSQKAFESSLAKALTDCDPSIPVVVEAESSKIGNLMVPPSLWQAMQSAPRIAISAPIAARAAYLVRAYADILSDRSELLRLTQSLIPLQGKEQVSAWVSDIDAGAYQKLAEGLMRQHYDPRYARSRASAGAPSQTVLIDTLDAPDQEQAADRIAALIESGEVFKARSET